MEKAKKRAERATIEKDKVGTIWAVCPYCGKKAIPLHQESRLYKVPWKCRNTRCKKDFYIFV